MNKARVMFFWDYDSQWGGDVSRSASGRKDYGDFEYVNTQRLLELHESYEAPACFAVVGSVATAGDSLAYHNPKQIQAIHEAGNEVASHSMKHDWLVALNYEKLLATLRDSKDALEQCIGHQVTTFVPPYNAPFDYLRKLAPSIQERIQVRAQRTDIPLLCKALRETGYTFTRLSYYTLIDKIRSRVDHKAHSPRQLERINGVTCIRLSRNAGFGESANRLIDACIQKNAYAVLYGHPHSITKNCPQNEYLLVEVLEYVRDLQKRGLADVVLPRDMVSARPGTHDNTDP